MKKANIKNPCCQFAAVIALILLFFWGGWFGWRNLPAVKALDSRFSVALGLSYEPLRSAFVSFIDVVSGFDVIIGLAILVAVIYFRQNDRRYAYGLLLSVLGTAAFAFISRNILIRPSLANPLLLYPADTLISEHTALLLSLGGFLVYHYWTKFPEDRLGKALVLSGISADLLMTIFSQLYIGTDYLSNIVIGLIAGGLWLVVGIAASESRT